MADVKVKLFSPDGRGYWATIDEQAEAEALLKALVERLNLPVKNESEPSKDYELQLVDALRIHEGVTIRLNERRPSRKILLVE